MTESSEGSQKSPDPPETQEASDQSTDEAPIRQEPNFVLQTHQPDVVATPEGSSEKQAPGDGGGGFQRIVKMLGPVVDKTKLDIEACRDVVGRLLSDEEVRVKQVVEERIKEQAGQPVKPPHPIASYRKATPCSVKWDDMSGTDKFRICGTCKQFVYDFRDMELADAERIVFQREEKKSPNFYQRKDGRFLTNDCPVGVKRGRSTLMAIGGGVLLIIVLIMLMMQAPKPQPAANTESKPASQQGNSSGNPQASPNPAGQ